MRRLLTLALLALSLAAPALAQVVIVTDASDAEAADTLRDLGYTCSVERQEAPGKIAMATGADCQKVSLAQPAILMGPTALPARPSGGTTPVLVLIGSREAAPDEWVKLAEAAGHKVEVKKVDNPVTGLQIDNDPTQKAVRRFITAQNLPPVQGLSGVPFVASPNWDVRSREGTIDTVVVHSTVINTMAGTQRAFLDDKVRRVSAHYVVDRDGTTVQMVDERFTAWHAGVSELEGRTGVNDFSVGVELVNLNDGKDPYPEAQVQALVRIIKDLRTRWDIPDERIVSHAFVARPPGRKNDPLGFDFEKLLQLLRR